MDILRLLSVAISANPLRLLDLITHHKGVVRLHCGGEWHGWRREYGSLRVTDEG
jgi:hypothetical protein